MATRFSRRHKYQRLPTSSQADQDDRQAEWAIEVARAKGLLHKAGGDRRSQDFKNSRDKLIMEQAEIETISEKVGISVATITRCIKIFSDSTPEVIKQEVRNAELPIKHVYEFMAALDKFPEEKKEPFLEEFKEGKISQEVTEIAECSQKAKDELEQENKLVQAAVLPNFEDKLWTRAFDVKELQRLERDLRVANGGNPKLETRFIEVPEITPENTEEARELAKKLGGRYLGTQTKYFHEIEVDPFKATIPKREKKTAEQRLEEQIQEAKDCLRLRTR